MIPVLREDYTTNRTFPKDTEQIKDLYSSYIYLYVDKAKTLSEVKMETLEILKQSIIEGNIVKLPDIQLDRKQYLEVKKKLEGIDGKWKGGKTAGFVFEENPTELLKQVSNGENRNLKKENQFFETPEALADKLVGYANLQPDDLVLEPSAGRGAIIKAINSVLDYKLVDCYEIMELNKTYLEKMENANLIGSDFLKFNITNRYNKIIANPTFNKNQDIDHIRKMFSCLKEGGRLVTIASKHWQGSNNKKEKEFREWLEENNVTPIEIDAGEFKDSGTMIPTCIIIMDNK